jgi:polysaccharide chain length determinant protein (PEP-CTERM system associated)
MRMFANFDLKFYAAIFLRRLPYFLVIVVLLSTTAITVAYILPPVYRSQASILVEPPQISDDLAQTTVAVNPYEQAQIIAQRLMTRQNRLELAERVGLYKDMPEMSAGEIASDIRKRVEFIGFEPDPTMRPELRGATIIGVAFEAPTPDLALKGTNELVSLVLEENVRLRTTRAEGTSEFFQTEVERLAGELERKSAEIAEFKTANFQALPDSLVARRSQQQLEQERLLALEREEAALRNQRATAVWVFERTGRGTVAGATPEEDELQVLRSQLIQQRAIYQASSPQVRILESRIAALESLVEEQRAERAMPGPDGQAEQPMSALDLELAPIDARLQFIEEEKALIRETLAELDRTIQATPNNEMVLNRLETQLANLRLQYDNAVAASGQAEVGERLEVLSKGERFSLIEPPSEPGGPVRPWRILIASAGVVGGIGAGLGFVLLLELLNRSIRRPVELTSGLGIQPFATVPYIRTREEFRRKRGVIALALAVVLLVIPAGLYLTHKAYMPLDLLLDSLLDTLGLVDPMVSGGQPQQGDS